MCFLYAESPPIAGRHVSEALTTRVFPHLNVFVFHKLAILTSLAAVPFYCGFLFPDLKR